MGGVFGPGGVVSVAPLLGSQAAVDVQHKRWLHIHVRPPVRGLLKTLKVCKTPPGPWRVLALSSLTSLHQFYQQGPWSGCVL
jgi:hypothetical protein